MRSAWWWGSHLEPAPFGGPAREGDSVLLPLGSPLPDDSVAAKRGVSGMLGGLTVPLSWGVSVYPDDYDHWAPESDDDVRQPVPGEITNTDADESPGGEWNEWGEWVQWEAEEEPRFEAPRSTKVVPQSF